MKILSNGPRKPPATIITKYSSFRMKTGIKIKIINIRRKKRSFGKLVMFLFVFTIFWKKTVFSILYNIDIINTTALTGR